MKKSSLDLSVESLTCSRSYDVSETLDLLHGVLIRVPNLAQPLVVVGLSDAGLDFDAPDGQLAHVVFLLLTPAESPTAQLDLSANIAELFRDPRSLEHVLRAHTYTEFLAALKTAAPKASR